MKSFTFVHKTDDKRQPLVITAANKQAAEAKLEFYVSDVSEWKLHAG